MKRYIIIVLVLISAGSVSLFAQEANNFELEWNISIPMGEFKDWIDETSTRGIEFGGSHRFETNVTVGGNIAYSAFFKKTEVITVEQGTVALTAKHLRDLYSYNFLAEGGYAFPTDANLVPYAKVGIGAYYTEQVTQIGLLYKRDDNWNFGLRPEVGLYYAHPRALVGVIANVKYNYIAGYDNPSMGNFSYLTFSIGAVFTF